MNVRSSLATEVKKKASQWFYTFAKNEHFDLTDCLDLPEIDKKIISTLMRVS